MTQIPVLFVEGTTGVAVNPVKRLYDAFAQACGAVLVALPDHGIRDIWATDIAFAAIVDELLGRTADTPEANEPPAILVGHSAAGPHIAMYLTRHPGDRAILVSSPMEGLDYLRPVNDTLRLTTKLGLPAVRNLVHHLFPLIEDLSPESRFLAEVRSMAHLYADRVMVIAAAHDHVVPWRSSVIPGAPTMLLVESEEEYRRHSSINGVACMIAPGAGHVECLRQATVIALIGHYISECLSACTPLHLASA